MGQGIPSDSRARQACSTSLKPCLFAARTREVMNQGKALLLTLLASVFSVTLTPKNVYHGGKRLKCWTQPTPSPQIAELAEDQYHVGRSFVTLATVISQCSAVAVRHLDPL
jgi:hypothetical protein